VNHLQTKTPAKVKHQCLPSTMADKHWGQNSSLTFNYVNPK